MKLEIGTHCRITVEGDEYDRIRCIVTSPLKDGEYQIEFLEASESYAIGYTTTFDEEDLKAISPLELLAEVMDDA